MYQFRLPRQWLQAQAADEARVVKETTEQRMLHLMANSSATLRRWADRLDVVAAQGVPMIQAVANFHSKNGRVRVAAVGAFALMTVSTVSTSLLWWALIRCGADGGKRPSRRHLHVVDSEEGTR
jgi:hypothetical protein